MRALYDTQADALSIDLIDADRWDATDAVDPDYCTVALVNDRPANLELIAPREHLDLLETAADRHVLDVVALTAAAHSALAAADRVVVLDVLASA